MDKLKEAIEEFVYNTDNCADVAQVGWMLNDGTVLVSEMDACHAALEVYSYDEVYYAGGSQVEDFDIFDDLEYVFSLMMDHEFNKEQTLRFTNWMCSDSPWADCFITSGEDVANTDVWVLDPDVPCNLLGGACIATRLISEKDKIFSVWWELTEAGVDPTKAFWLSHHLVQVDGAIQVGYQESYHLSIPSYFTKEGYNNFINKKPSSNSKKSYRDKLGYTGIDSTWGQHGYGSLLNYESFKTIPSPTNIKLHQKRVFKPKVKETGAVFKTPQDLRHLVSKMEEIINAT